MTNEKNSINVIFGKNVKLYRKNRNLTQDDLGEMIGVSSKYISNIERGVSFPSSSIISQIATILDIQPYQLFIPEETTIANPYESYVSKKALIKEISKKINNLLEEI